MFASDYLAGNTRWAAISSTLLYILINEIVPDR